MHLSDLVMPYDTPGGRWRTRPSFGLRAFLELVGLRPPTRELVAFLKEAHTWRDVAAEKMIMT